MLETRPAAAPAPDVHTGTCSHASGAPSTLQTGDAVRTEPAREEKAAKRGIAKHGLWESS